MRECNDKSGGTISLNDILEANHKKRRKGNPIVRCRPIKGFEDYLICDNGDVYSTKSQRIFETREIG